MENTEPRGLASATSNRAAGFWFPFFSGALWAVFLPFNCLDDSGSVSRCFVNLFPPQPTPGMAGNVKRAAEKQGDAHLKPGSPTARACSCRTEVSLACYPERMRFDELSVFSEGSWALGFRPLRAAGSVH